MRAALLTDQGPGRVYSWVIDGATRPRSRQRALTLILSIVFLASLASTPVRAGPPPMTTPTNRLAKEKSLYLRQHGNNPVDWYPWGEEAFQKARREDRPILVSIGYSTCHWCHVMERESFENQEIARLLNEHFVAIKVDREERPDVDQIYMAALQAMGQDGGWPLNLFLTPDLRPFYGGTYFPPTDRHGRPGFKSVLDRMTSVWKTDRKEIDVAAGRARKALERVAAHATAADLDPTLLDRYAQAYERRADATYGGLAGAPKFPRSYQLDVLIRRGARRGDKGLPVTVVRALDGMASGGMYDHIGGGFHRYSTDSTWTVPHFEKMLYDNALLAVTYLEAYQVGHDPQHLRVLRDTLDYLLREMRHPGGAFYAATDADSEGHEGRFFVWTPAQVESVLGKDEGALFCRRFGVTASGNFEGGASVLTARSSLDDLARTAKITVADLQSRLDRSRESMRAARIRRPAPALDEKVISSWAALTVSALARTAQVLDEPRYAQAAREGAAFLLPNMVIDGRVRRRWIGGHDDLPGTAEDQAAVLLALLDVYEMDFDEALLVRAGEVGRVLVSDFADPATGGFRTARPRADLLVGLLESYDGAIPSPNSLGAMALARLGLATADDALLVKARAACKACLGTAAASPLSAPYLLMVMDFLTSDPLEVVVAGDPAAADTKALLKAIRAVYHPWKVVLLARPGTKATVSPLLAGKVLVDGRAAVYVCRARTCRAPVTSPAAVKDALSRRP